MGVGGISYFLLYSISPQKGRLYAEKFEDRPQRKVLYGAPPLNIICSISIKMIFSLEKYIQQQKIMKTPSLCTSKHIIFHTHSTTLYLIVLSAFVVCYYRMQSNDHF